VRPKSNHAEALRKFHLKILGMCYIGNFSICTFADIQKQEVKGKKNLLKIILEPSR